MTLNMLKNQNCLFFRIFSIVILYYFFQPRFLLLHKKIILSKYLIHVHPVLTIERKCIKLHTHLKF